MRWRKYFSNNSNPIIRWLLSVLDCRDYCAVCSFRVRSFGGYTYYQWMYSLKLLQIFTYIFIISFGEGSLLLIHLKKGSTFKVERKSQGCWFGENFFDKKYLYIVNFNLWKVSKIYNLACQKNHFLKIFIPRDHYFWARV